LAAEVHVPFVRRGEHRWLYNADLSAVGRCDWQSEGTNSGLKPYFGLRVQPVQRLTLRASLARTFRAPMLPMLYGGMRESLQSGLPDLRRPQALTNDVFDGTTQMRSIRRAGNPNLGPSHSRAYQFGVVYDLPGELLKGLTVGATFYSFLELDYPFTPGTNQIRYNEVGGGTADLVIREPGTETYVATVPVNILSGPNGAMTAIAPGQTVTVPGRIRYISDSYAPAYHTRVKGWDFSATYARNLGKFGRVRLRSSAAYLDYIVSKLMARPMPNAAGLAYQLPRTRLQSSLMWMHAPWNAGITCNYNRRSGEAVDLTEVASYTVVGATVSRAFRGDAKNWLAGTRLTLGVDNAFDQAPPLNNQASGYLPGFVRRPAGRFFYAELKKSL
jgi:iron complex outermembrane receptor protein